VARQRNNIYAVAADAVDLALDTAGTIGSMVGGMASMIGIGGSSDHQEQQQKSDEERREAEQQRREIDDAAQRMTASLNQEAEAAKPRVRKATPSSTHTRKARPSRSVKAKSVKSTRKTTKRRAA